MAAPMMRLVVASSVFSLVRPGAAPPSYNVWEHFLDAYCPAVGHLDQSVQPLAAEERATVTGLRQVQVALRHGERDLYTKLECFPEWKPHFNCSLHERFSVTEDQSQPWSFIKHYRRGCEVGQLLPSAVPRVQAAGNFIREAYLGPGRPLGPLHMADSDAVYVHSTDMERTLATAYVLVDALRNGGNGSIELHTTDLADDAWKLNGCPSATAAYQGEWPGGRMKLERLPEYKEFKKRWFAAIGMEHTPGLSAATGFNFDCILVGLCEKQAMPRGLTDELRDEALRWSESYVKDVYADTVAIRMFAYRMVSEMEKMWNTDKKLVIWSSHDTSLLALWSGLGVWDGMYPAYAEMTTLEVYDLKSGGTAVRLLRRGKPLRLPGCGAAALCPAERLLGPFDALRGRGESMERLCTQPLASTILAETRQVAGPPLAAAAALLLSTLAATLLAIRLAATWSRRQGSGGYVQMV